MASSAQIWIRLEELHALGIPYTLIDRGAAGVVKIEMPSRMDWIAWLAREFIRCHTVTDQPPAAPQFAR